MTGAERAVTFRWTTRECVFWVTLPARASGELVQELRSIGGDVVQVSDDQMLITVPLGEVGAHAVPVWRQRIQKPVDEFFVSRQLH